jgi:hypothetical protein
MGDSALYANTTANDNCAFGQSALSSNTTGSSNVAIGRDALVSNTTASYNTAVGYQALNANTTSRNTAIGVQAGYAVTTGDSTIFVGFQAANNLVSGYAGVYLGAYCLASSSSAAYENVIGNGMTGKGNSTTFIGNQGSSSCYQSNNSATWSITSDQRLKKNIVDNTVGLSAINGIQVRNFEYRLPEEITELEPQNAIAITGVQLGTIAQELIQVLPDCVKTESTGVMSVDSSSGEYGSFDCCKPCLDKLWEKYT